VDILSRALNGIFDLLLAPFGDHAWPGLIFVSLLSGVLLLWLFKLATPQKRLARARGRLMGHLYEQGLYQDDLGVLMRIQRDFALANLRYLATALPALLVMVPVVGLIVVQLEARYQHEAVPPGAKVLIAATVDPARPELLDVLSLSAAEGLTIDSPAVRDPERNTVWWRVRIDEPGRREVAVGAPGGERWTKQIKAETSTRRFALTRTRSGLWTALGNPAEPPLPGDAPLLALAMVPPAESPWFRQGWFWGFCLFSIVGGLAVKKLLRVEF